MNNNKKLLIISSIFAIALLLFAALTKLPTGFYTFLRIYLFLFSAKYAYEYYVKNMQMRAFSAFLILILFNPIVIISFPRDVWKIMDFIVIAIICLNLFYEQWKANKE